jgi:hypothetical protein
VEEEKRKKIIAGTNQTMSQFWITHIGNTAHDLPEGKQVLKYQASGNEVRNPAPEEWQRKKAEKTKETKAKNKKIKEEKDPVSVNNTVNSEIVIKKPAIKKSRQVAFTSAVAVNFMSLGQQSFQGENNGNKKETEENLVTIALQVVTFLLICLIVANILFLNFIHRSQKIQAKPI